MPRVSSPGSSRSSKDSLTTPEPRALQARRLGTLAYAEAAALQQQLVARRRRHEIADQLLLLQHPHVITLGSSARAEHVLADEATRRLLDIEIHETGRGGDVTYHGPGQLIGYPILDLKPDRCDLHRYIRDIEAALITLLAEYGLGAGRKDGLTGVWVGDAKVAAIGVRVSSGWITSHGFALNVSTDLTFFDAIVPCGIRDRAVTSLERETGGTVDFARAVARVTHHFADVFARAVSHVP